MNNYKQQITTLKQILEGLETVFDRRTPPFGDITKEDLKELRHWAIFVHAEMDDGMTTTILHYFYPKGILIRDKPLTGPQLARARFLYDNFIERLGFARRLEVFRKLNETYEFDVDLFRLMTRVNDIRNDFAHPSWNSLGKYVSFRQLHRAYADLVDGITAFKVAIEKVKTINLSLD
ncbi:hypothetical protein HYS91_05215 [Candidatus Daviesbacteria bacterium]|nr:hypothetical protein [Candidatus Daviesbacteria bacterium]